MQSFQYGLSRDEKLFHGVTHHKKDMSTRKKFDAKEGESLRERFQSYNDPLNPSSHPTDIVNIVSGHVASESVDVDNSVAIGKKQMKLYEATWSDGFYHAVAKKVVTMAETKWRTCTRCRANCDTGLIFSRVMGTMASCDLDVKDLDVKRIFRYELGLIPTSLFTDSGDMRTTKTTKENCKWKNHAEHCRNQIL